MFLFSGGAPPQCGSDVLIMFSFGSESIRIVVKHFLLGWMHDQAPAQAECPAARR